MWNYFFLDNGGKEMTLSNGRKWRRTVREQHHCESIEEAVVKAKQLTFGERIEIFARFGWHSPKVIVEPDGSIHNSLGNPVCLYDTDGNRL